jgi:hypothetical protein
MILIFCFRTIRRVHCTLVGQYLELGPIFLFPVFGLIYARSGSAVSPLCYLSTVLVSQIVIFGLIALINWYMTRQIFKVFGGFFRPNSIDKIMESPPGIFGSFVYVLRIISIKSANPEFFLRFLSSEPPNERMSSQLIEAARFLALFPSKRQLVLDILKNCHPKSFHNSFTVHMFKKILRSLMFGAKPKHLELFRELRHGFIMHHHLFWKYRSENRWFKAFREAIATAFCHNGMENEGMALMERFPFDPLVRREFARFLLDGRADVAKSKSMAALALELELQRNRIPDPLLHPMSLQNPNVLLFCTDEERMIAQPSKPPSNSAAVQSSVSMSNRSFHPVNWLASLLSIVGIVIFMALAWPSQRALESTADLLPQHTRQTMHFLDDLQKWMVPFPAFPHNVTGRQMNTSECLKLFPELLNELVASFDGTELMRGILENQVMMTYRFFGMHIRNGDGVCEAIADYIHPRGLIDNERIEELSKRISKLSALVQTMDESISITFALLPALGLLAAISLLLAVLSLMIVLIQVNRAMKDEPQAIAFLASSERLNLRLQNRFAEAWKLVDQLEDLPESSDGRPLLLRSRSHSPDRLSSQLVDGLEEEDSLEPQSLRGSKLRKAWIQGLLTIMAPIAVLMLAEILAMAPILARAKYQAKATAEVLPLIHPLQLVSQLLGIVYGVGQYAVNKTEELREIQTALSSADGRFVGLYNRCFVLSQSWLPCSLNHLLQGLIGFNGRLGPGLFAFASCGFVIHFIQVALDELLLPSLDQLAKIRCSSGTAFLFMFVVMAFFVLSLILVGKFVWRRDLNSLFHFPEQYLRATHRMENANQKFHFPQMILVVSHVRETDEIYSVTGDSMSILNQSPCDFICHKLSEVFPIVESTTDEIREYTFPDRRTKKRFRSSSQTFGRITKTVLVEEFHVGINQDQLCQQLTHFIPSEFAKLYCERDSTELTQLRLQRFYLIGVRLNSEMPPRFLDRVFPTISNNRQNYSSMALLKHDGSLMVFATRKPVQPLVPLHFIRDVLVSCLQLVKHPSGECPIIAVLVDWIREGLVTVTTKGEPSLEIGIDQLQCYEAQVFMLPKASVAVGISAAQKIPNFVCDLPVSQVFNPVLNCDVQLYLMSSDDYLRRLALQN